MNKIIEKKHLQKAMDYESYRKLIDELLRQGKTTGQEQSEQRIAYATLNVERMKTIDKIIQVVPEIEHLIKSVQQPQKWIVLTEGWCRDAAQIVPVLHALAKLNSNIELKLLLRDENLDLMDQYLTNGKSRSIPRLIAVDSDEMEELFNWGVSPAIQQSPPDEKTMITQKEIGELVAQHVHKSVRVLQTIPTFSVMKKACPPAVAYKNAAFPTIFILLMLCLCGISGYAQKAVPSATPIAKKAQPQFTYTIINGVNGTFGYDVYADGRLQLHQPSIPAMPGNEGFKTKAAAEQVAQLAIKKMKKGESLPTISPEELKKLKVI